MQQGFSGQQGLGHGFAHGLGQQGLGHGFAQGFGQHGFGQAGLHALSQGLSQQPPQGPADKFAPSPKTAAIRPNAIGLKNEFIIVTLLIRVFPLN